MTIGLSDVLSTLQNGVRAINDLTFKIGTVFPLVGTPITISSSNAGVTFQSTQAVAYLSVLSSSGGVFKVPLY